jgi:putative phosphoribosyl transferase
VPGDQLAEIADRVVCVIAPSDFRAVGQWYDRFDQTSDTEVADALRAVAARSARARGA